MVDLTNDDEVREATNRAPRARGRAVPGAVGAAAIVVAPSGDDTGPGTVERPIATLHEAQRRLREAPGGAVVLTDGTWHLDRPLRLDVSSLVGTELDAQLVKDAVNAASTGLDAMSDLQASAAYRRRVAVTLCIRALEQARAEAAANPAEATR